MPKLWNKRNNKIIILVVPYLFYKELHPSIVKITSSSINGNPVSMLRGEMIFPTVNGDRRSPFQSRKIKLRNQELLALALGVQKSGPTPTSRDNKIHQSGTTLPIHMHNTSVFHTK
jgi:hypothetical protein